MKCPKCNYVSFEYLNSCKKCNLDLTAHKAELGIDFPQYSDLGILALMAVPAEAVAVEEAVDTVEAEGGTAESSADADILSIGEAIDMDDNSLDLSGGIEPAGDETLITETEQAVEGLDTADTSRDTTADDGNEDIDLSEIDEPASDTATALEEEAGAVPFEADGEQAAPTQSADVEVEEADPDLSMDEALDALGDADDVSLDANEVETVETGTVELGDMDNLEINLDEESTEETSTQEESVVEETAETDTAELDNMDNLEINLDEESTEETSTQEESVVEETAETDTVELGDAESETAEIDNLDNLEINLDEESMEETSTQEESVVEETAEDADGDEELDLSLDDIDLDMDFNDEELLDDDEDKQS